MLMRMRASLARPYRLAALLLAAALVAALGLAVWRQRGAPAPLVLADHAEDLLVQLSSDGRSLRVDLSDALTRPVAGATVVLHLLPFGGQGSERRLTARPGLLRPSAYTARVAPAPAGRRRVEVSVARPGRQTVTAAFAWGPWAPAPPGLLAQIDAAMNRLHSLRQRQWLGYGEVQLVTDFEFAAPNRMHLQTNKGFERIAVGSVMYEREAGAPWTRGEWPGIDPFAWPDSNYAQDAVDVRTVDREPVDGTPCLVVAFLHRPSGARFRLWVGEQDYRVRRSLMMAPGHFMRDDFGDFDQPLNIAAPLA